MTGEELKRAILQQAIQGKLVAQDSNDEPASVLLARIREEKAKLIKEGKIKKDKNESIIYRGGDNSYYEKFANGTVKCIDDEIPFELPQNWEWCRLGVTITLLSGQDLIPSRYNSSCNGIPYITGASNFDEGKLLINRWTNSPSSISKFGDLLMTCKGTIGEMAINNVGDIHIARQVMSIRPILLNTKYVQAFLTFMTPYLQKNAHSLIPGISRDTVLSAMLPLPPHDEQSRIVKRLNELMPFLKEYGCKEDELCNLNNKLKESLLKAILQQAIQGKLVAQDSNDEPASELSKKIRNEKERLIKKKIIKQEKNEAIIFRGDDNKYFEKKGKVVICIDDEIPFDLPQGWEWKRLADIALVYTGNSISETEKKLKYQDVSGREYIGTKDVGFDNSITYNNGVAIPSKYEAEFRKAPKDSVLMCIEGGSAGRKIAILDREVCFGNKLCCFSPFNPVLSKYLFFYLQSPSFYDMFNANKTGIIGGVSIANVKNLLIPIPPKAEIMRIIDKIEVVTASIMSR